MKRLFAFTLLLVFSLSTHCFSQKLNLNWSPKMNYDNSKDGFFNSIIGSTEERIFVLYNKYSTSGTKGYSKMKVVALDRSSMTPVGSVFLRGDKSNLKRKEQLNGMEYYSIFEKNDNLYVFWQKYGKETVEIYAEVYSPDLELIESLKKIYSIDKTPSNKGNAKVGVVILNNENIEQSIIIGCEVHKGKNENISFDYAVIGMDLNEISKSENELSVVQNKKNSSFSTRYTYGNDGMIYLRSEVGFDLESETDRNNKTKKGKREYYLVLSMINPKTGEFVSEDLKFEGYGINGYHMITSENGTSLYGFFRDLNKEGKGSRSHGIFYATIDPKTFELSEPHFSYFSKDLIDDLFKGDEEDKKRSTALIKKKRRRETEQNKDVLDGQFVIEIAKNIADGGLILFCSKMYNYSVTTCTSVGTSGRQTCTTDYYCQKSNVTVFRLDSEGEIVWAKNTDRKYTYKGTSIYDLRVVEKNETFYVIYANQRSDEVTKGGRKKNKRGAELRDNFEYVTVNLEDGETEKSIVEVNKRDTKSKDRKMVAPTEITVINDEFFVNSSTIRIKPVGCITSILCPPMIFVILDNSLFMEGYGHLGRIEITD